MNFVARDRQRKSTLPTVAVVDSQSIRTGLPHSIKSVDGGKKIKGISYHRPGQSSCICVRLFRSQCNRIAPSLREHICTTLDRPSVNKYWGTGSSMICGTSCHCKGPMCRKLVLLHLEMVYSSQSSSGSAQPFGNTLCSHKKPSNPAVREPTTIPSLA